MKKYTAVAYNKEMARDFSKVISKSLITLGSKKKELPWFSSSAKIQHISDIKKAS